MKRYLLAIVLLLPFILQAKVAVEKPRSKQPTAFAIVVDQATYDKTAPQIHAYRDVLEADGLSTYILRDNWQTPEQVREQLIALMRKTAKRSPLEGVVFVGDIPIAMVRNAQHLTTAFKMDEDNFPMIQSSVPSDRYYDCPDLQFELIARDTTDRLLSYFNLACDSPQRLDPAFYSGRIRYPEQLGGDKYEGIARYLEKVVAERGKVDQLDNLVTYAGDGYNSDCLVCWMDERVAIDENFPLTDTRKAGNLRQLNFRMDDYMKYRVFDELVRPEVDAMFFNEHGSPDKQHVGSYTTEPDSFDGQYSQLKAEVMIALYMERRKGDKADVEGAKQYFKEKYHLTDAFFETKKTEADDDTKAKGDQTIVSLEDLETLAAQPRFVMLNACYNGSFHKPGYITGYYIFGPGRTVATQGNTVNVLQDRWTYELVGLLSHGVRVGQYNRLIASLEGHIIGDPAFRFQPVEPNTLATDMTTRKGDAAYWRSLLASPWADVQSLALRMLTDAGAISAGELLEFMKQSPLATTRMECLKLIGRFGDEEIFAQAIIRGLKDRYELLRRNAATYAWQSSRLELLPALADTYVNDSESKRVAHCHEGAGAVPRKRGRTGAAHGRRGFAVCGQRGKIHRALGRGRRRTSDEGAAAESAFQRQNAQKPHLGHPFDAQQHLPRTGARAAETRGRRFAAPRTAGQHGRVSGLVRAYPAPCRDHRRLPAGSRRQKPGERAPRRADANRDPARKHRIRTDPIIRHDHEIEKNRLTDRRLPAGPVACSGTADRPSRREKPHDVRHFHRQPEL